MPNILYVCWLGLQREGLHLLTRNLVLLAYYVLRIRFGVIFGFRVGFLLSGHRIVQHIGTNPKPLLFPWTCTVIVSLEGKTGNTNKQLELNYCVVGSRAKVVDPLVLSCRITGKSMCVIFRMR
jgi:hypothetical protein